jgi:hypothetical protein
VTPVLDRRRLLDLEQLVRSLAGRDVNLLAGRTALTHAEDLLEQGLEDVGPAPHLRAEELRPGEMLLERRRCDESPTYVMP